MVDGMNKNYDRFEAGSVIWVTAFILANLRGTVVWDVLKQGFGLAGLPWIEVFIWILLSVMAVRALLRDNLISAYLRLWKRNWILLVFIGVACLSILWSVSPSASLYRSAALLFSSLIGAYLGVRYPLDRLLNILFKFGALLLIICFALALFLPVVGAMDWEPYNGAWRGIFWHKNQLGSFAALFSLVFLIGALAELGKIQGKPALYAMFYLFSLVVIYFSKSVAGYFLCIILSFSAVLAFFWLKMRPRLKAIHYYGILGLGILGVVILIPNLDLVFGLFNRNTSLTGRVPLWSYLIGEVFPESPWLGHGFGAIWSTRSFRIATQQVVGWEFPVAIGDNGFLDILLHVGLMGFIPFLGVLIALFVRSGRFALQHLSIISFFPLLLAVFAVIANLSFSLFLETETFLWLLMVAMLFTATSSQQPAQAG